MAEPPVPEKKVRIIMIAEASYLGIEYKDGEVLFVTESVYENIRQSCEIWSKRTIHGPLNSKILYPGKANQLIIYNTGAPKN